MNHRCWSSRSLCTARFHVKFVIVASSHFDLTDLKTGHYSQKAFMSLTRKGWRSCLFAPAAQPTATHLGTILEGWKTGCLDGPNICLRTRQSSPHGEILTDNHDQASRRFHSKTRDQGNPTNKSNCWYTFQGLPRIQ